MGANHNPNMKSGIKINGTDAFDIHPDTVKGIIQSDETGIVKAIFEAKLLDVTEKLYEGVDMDTYAQKYGRPPISELPLGRSENDGYKYLDGHAPNCSGPEEGYVGGCWCFQFTDRGGTIHEKPMWVGGPDLDDFDM